MSVSQTDQLSVLRRQRNILFGAAAAVLLTAFGVSLPNATARRKQLTELNLKLIDLQGWIGSRQNAIRATQAEILKTQAEITAVQQQTKL